MGGPGRTYLYVQNPRHAIGSFRLLSLECFHCFSVLRWMDDFYFKNYDGTCSLEKKTFDVI